MTLGSRLFTLPYDAAYHFLRLHGAFKAPRLLSLGSGEALKIPLEAAESIARFGWRHPVILGGGVLTAGSALEKAKSLESAIRSNRMGLSYAKFSSCSDLDAFEQKKTYLSEKVAFEKFASPIDIFGNDLGRGARKVVEKGLGHGFGGTLLTGMAAGLGAGAVAVGLTQIGRLLGMAGRSVKERAILNKQRESILDNLMENDYVISTFENENPGSTLKAYATMVRVAPTLSTDPNVVTSFLRNSSQTGGTMDFATIKLLADAEASVSKARNPENSWSLQGGGK